MQISAYLDNVFDVGALMEDSMTKAVYIERAEELESELAQAQEEMQEVEAEAMHKVCDLEQTVAEVRRERDELLEKMQQVGDSRVVGGGRGAAGVK